MTVLSKETIEQTVKDLYMEMRETLHNDVQLDFIKHNYVEEQIELAIYENLEKLEDFFVDSFQLDIDLADELFAWVMLDKVYDRIHDRQKNIHREGRKSAW